jgi:hypothetical protein
VAAGFLPGLIGLLVLLFSIAFLHAARGAILATARFLRETRPIRRNHYTFLSAVPSILVYGLTPTRGNIFFTRDWYNFGGTAKRCLALSGPERQVLINMTLFLDGTDTILRPGGRIDNTVLPQFGLPGGGTELVVATFTNLPVLRRLPIVYPVLPGREPFGGVVDWFFGEQS